MELKSIRRALKHELRAEKNGDLFQNASRRHPELSGHETPMSVLAVLGDSAASRWEEKDALVRAIIKEQQERPHEFWTSLLIVAFYPMLSRLRHRILGDVLTPDDLDQLVVSSFLEVVSSFPLAQKTDRTCMHLRQMNQRRVFRLLRREQSEQESVLAVKVDELERLEEELVEMGDPEELSRMQRLRWPETSTTRSKKADIKEQARMTAFLKDRVGADIEEDRLELLIATQVRGEMLSRYVARLYPEISSKERRRTYQRIKRRHSRALTKLRKLLNEKCPRTDPIGALPLRSRCSCEGGEEI